MFKLRALDMSGLKIAGVLEWSLWECVFRGICTTSAQVTPWKWITEEAFYRISEAECGVYKSDEGHRLFSTTSNHLYIYNVFYYYYLFTHIAIHTYINDKIKINKLISINRLFFSFLFFIKQQYGRPYFRSSVMRIKFCIIHGQSYL